jgi:hypothetical protein
MNKSFRNPILDLQISANKYFLLDDRLILTALDKNNQANSTFQFSNQDIFECAVIINDAFIIASSQNIIYYFDRTGERAIFRWHLSEITHLIYDYQRELSISASNDGTICVHKKLEEKMIFEIPNSFTTIETLHYDEKRGFLALTEGEHLIIYE